MPIKIILLVFCLCGLLFIATCSPLNYRSDSGKYGNNGFDGEAKLKKEIFYYDDNMTSITKIICGELDSDPGLDIGIFDQFSLHILDLRGNVKSKIIFSWDNVGIIEPDIRIEQKGLFAILACSIGPFGVMDNYGKPIWTYKDSLAYQMTFGDLNKDNVPEYYLTRTDLIQLDSRGHEIKKFGKFYFNDVKIYNPSNNYNSLVAALEHSGAIRFFDYSGNLVKEISPPKKLSAFEFSYWHNQDVIIGAAQQSIYILDMKGGIIYQDELKNINGSIANISVAPVRFYKDKRCLATLAEIISRTGHRQSLLSIVSPTDKVIYQELLKSSTGLAAVPCNVLNNECLLVGDGSGKVIKYSLDQ